MTGDVKFRKKLTRAQFMAFMAAHPAAVVVMEACGSASYWARELSKAGHEVKLIAPQYVYPFVKRQKKACGLCRGDCDRSTPSRDTLR